MYVTFQDILLKDFFSHNANTATFDALRHLVTILVTDSTNPDLF